MTGTQGSTVVLKCPLDGCGWEHTEPAVDVPREALAGQFGLGAMAAVAEHQRAGRIEAELSRHFDRHKTEDFLRTITRLTQVNGELHRAIAAMSEMAHTNANTD